MKSGLPQPWAGHRQWTVLQGGFGLGLEFLALWRAWLTDEGRPGLLHFAVVEPNPVGAEDILRAAEAFSELQPLARDLAGQWFGLAPGIHRLAFAEDRVLLTLAIGEPLAALKSLNLRADALLLGAAPWDVPFLAGAAGLCRRGAHVEAHNLSADTRLQLVQLGFEFEGESPHGRFSPRWPSRRDNDGAAAQEPADCVVIGAGLAGAAAAASLARRGWNVRVLDAAAEPAAGASALPVGLMAVHTSIDDNLLSRLTRCGARITLQQAALLLAEGRDWAPCGVLERQEDTALPTEPLANPGLRAWTTPATDAQKAAGGLSADAGAWWHERSAWIRPAALVRAWLAQPGVTFHGGRTVEHVEQTGAGWRVTDAQGRPLAEAALVVLAAGLASAQWLRGEIVLRPVRGQVSYGPVPAGVADLAPFPINGNGHFVPRVPTAEGPIWLTGSSYGRGDADVSPRMADRLDNLRRLSELAPRAAEVLAPRFDTDAVRDWSGVRCVARDRRPLLGEVRSGLWVSTAMGSRGLTFAALCGELLAARLHGEPWPLSRRLAQALDVGRLGPAPRPASGAR
ncbi:FAD-dependent 5-carboxymethylaminomethyl-2-thiouridine(34) oxidoreductase MnmC [Caenimonas sedimenti]|uniref:FAD-dependent 5-carboxymethylaminomethyl-2-thiouridine(34) oxidoreductase MnmC n=1 Tax=Caenimonas sedimenti TaxID=2596921 RepID=UPI001645CBF6|nr:FAD-dependent 5-carboxymethylaminomethyl-2-thiouridine(34) oxidoreductase MnmC [Caenimonas sedimenti]